MDNLRILVVGGAGFIGTKVIERLLQYNIKKVVVLDNLSVNSGKKETSFNLINVNKFVNDDRYEFVSGDVRNIEDCMRVCKGINIICWFCGLGSITDSINNPYNYADTNIMGFINLITCANKSGVDRIIYASSGRLSTIDDPKNMLDVCNTMNEMIAKLFTKQYHIKTIGLRLFNVYGEGQSNKGVIASFLKNINSGKPLVITGDGNQKRDFTHIDNVVDTVINSMLITNPNSFGKIYDVATEELKSIKEISQIIMEYTRKVVPTIHVGGKRSEIKQPRPNIKETSKHLSYVPHVYFQEGIRRTIDYFRQFYKNI